MTAPTDTTPVAGDQTQAPAAPAATDAVTFTPEQQAAIDKLVNDRLERATRTAKEKADADKAAATKTLEQRLAELEKSSSEAVKAAEETALKAKLERLTANTHNPELVADLIRQKNPDLKAGDTAELQAATTAFIAENAWVNRAESGPDLTPSPGAASPVKTVGLLTAAELESMTAEDLRDPEKMKLYVESKKALTSRS